MYSTPSEPEIVVENARDDLRPPPAAPTLLALIETRRRPLALAAVAGALAGALVASALPPYYRSSARLVIVPADDPNAVRGSNALDVATATLPMLLSVLRSERVADAVVARLELDKLWALPPREAARRLDEKLDIDAERKSNLVTVAIDERTPARARDIVAAVTDTAAAVSVELWSARDREQRARLEQDRDATARALDQATAALQAFRERTHVIDLPAQVKASIEEAAALERARIDKVLALRFARGYGEKSAVEVQRAAREAAAVARELEALRHDDTRPGPLITLDRLPALEAEESRLKRALDTAAAKYELVTQKINQLAAASARPNGRAETIDPAVEPLRRAGPSRLRFAAGGALGAALALTAFFAAGARRRRRLQLS